MQVMGNLTIILLSEGWARARQSPPFPHGASAMWPCLLFPCKCERARGAAHARARCVRLRAPAVPMDIMVSLSQMRGRRTPVSVTVSSRAFGPKSGPWGAWMIKWLCYNKYEALIMMSKIIWNGIAIQNTNVLGFTNILLLFVNTWVLPSFPYGHHEKAAAILKAFKNATAQQSCFPTHTLHQVLK